MVDLLVQTHPTKGRGVYANERLSPGLYVIHYPGALLEGQDEISKRNQLYDSTGQGSFMVSFTFQSKKFCLDATDCPDSPSNMGRLINCSSKNFNLQPITHLIDGKPAVFFKTLTTIDKGIELLWDYNLNRTEQKDHPWYTSS